MNCPRCQHALQEMKYEGVSIDRCEKCGGVWLDEGEIAQIVDIKSEKFSPEIIRDVITHAFSGVPSAQRAPGAKAIKCPICTTDMRLMNYGYDSGVIIDRCPSSHGVWLDAGELERIQAYREEWDKEAPAHHSAWVKLVREVQDEQRPAAEVAGRMEHCTFMFRRFLGILGKLE